MKYRNWQICYDPPPIPDRRYDYTVTHIDYDGPEDGRCFTAASIQEAKELIDEYGDGGDVE